MRWLDWQPEEWTRESEGTERGFSTAFSFPRPSLAVVAVVSWKVESIIGGCLLLASPVHELVSDEHRDGPVKDLALGSAVGVENSGVCGTSESTLTVLGHGVGDDTTLRRGA